MKMSASNSLRRCCSTLGISICFLSSIIPRVHASVYVDSPFADRVYDSVAYFDFKDTKWPYVGPGDMLIGPVTVLTASVFDQFFMDYQEYRERGKFVTSVLDQAKPDNKETLAPHYGDDLDGDLLIATPPTFMILEYASSPYSASLTNIAKVAEWVGADFVVLAVNRETPWAQKMRFWWNHEFPGIPRGELEEMGQIVSAEGRQCVFLAVGPRQGRGMLEMLEKFQSWNLSLSQQFYFGIDTITTMTGQSFAIRVGGYLLVIFLFWRWTKYMDRRELLERNGGEEPIKYTGEDLGLGEVQTSTSHYDCCVCLEAMPPGETVRILPCRHAFHHECISKWVEQNKLTCPLCKMDLKKHLEERRKASEELAAITAPPRKTLRQLLWPWGRKIESLDDNHLICRNPEAHQEAANEGDLELTEERGGGVIV